MMKKPLQYYIGNALMAFSFLLLVFIYYPLFELYFFPQPIPKNAADYSFSIEIPRLHIFAPIIDNVDPFNDASYHEALTKGVALSRTGVEPGEKGTVYIFAHSSDFPWRITHYNTIFYRIGELQKGDSILITHNHHVYAYSVTSQKVVWPSEVDYITHTDTNQLILQTCTPIGTSFQRLLVFAIPRM